MVIHKYYVGVKKNVGIVGKLSLILIHNVRKNVPIIRVRNMMVWLGIAQNMIDKKE